MMSIAEPLLCVAADSGQGRIQEPPSSRAPQELVRRACLPRRKSPQDLRRGRFHPVMFSAVLQEGRWPPGPA
jgi:hypothetical protein